MEATAAYTDGLVVAGMGEGHVPPPVAEALARVARDVPVVLAGRCVGGPILTPTYSGAGTETDLLSAGVVPIGRSSAVKARLRLLVGLALGKSAEDIFPVDRGCSGRSAGKAAGTGSVPAPPGRSPGIIRAAKQCGPARTTSSYPASDQAFSRCAVGTSPPAFAGWAHAGVCGPATLDAAAARPGPCGSREASSWIMRDVDSPRSAKFGRVDPFCWVLVVPMLLLALLLIIDIDRLIGVLIAVLAIVIAVLDSWINRPGAQPPPRSKR